MAETSYGNGYLEGVKSRAVFSALTYFPIVGTDYSVQVRKGAVRETRYSVGTKLATFF